MNLKYIALLAASLLVISCSKTITTSSEKHQFSQISKLKSDWNINSGTWSLENDTLTGTGSISKWGVLQSKKILPENYEITATVNQTKESLLEFMLNLDNGKYIRTYLYQIDQNIVIGRGIYNPLKDDDRGGPSLFRKNIALQNNHWYNIKIRVLNKRLFFSVVDQAILECDIPKSNLNETGKIGFLTNGEIKLSNLIIKSL